MLWAAILANELGKKSEDVILVINNIDGVGLRYVTFFSVLSFLIFNFDLK